jgi:hypothetical protein
MAGAATILSNLRIKPNQAKADNKKPPEGGL